ncbi:hypothetical protein KZZ52_01150 [Dactylosporangium sp. AC04546]|uniref:hypothetical protein n=1 Tax=Dactylosporangium sp. AC04546 TaxID=2862460 RepID=UPI001EDF3E28|nr:hypothetical protein [Dactylosporangium sp. AC04546]WVK84081.1 hypothetical protein KZZ52_01150 [Dactylosporangium sp. AC04546]
MFRLTRAALAVGATVGAFAFAGPAAAGEPPASDLTVSTGRAQLTLAEGGGYAGVLPVRLTYRGQAAASVDVIVAQPAGIRFAGEQDLQLQTCFPDAAHGDRALRCTLMGGMTNGEVRDLRIRFTSLAGPQAKTRLSEPATITVENVGGPADASPSNNQAQFRARLQGTGNGVQPGTYQPAATPDLSVQAGPTKFTSNGDGTYTGELVVTVSGATDAEHDEVGIALAGVAGTPRVLGQPIGCFGSPEWPCRIDPVAKGTQRVVTIVIWTTQPPADGAQLTVSVTAMRSLAAVADANPADNATTSTVHVN